MRKRIVLGVLLVSLAMALNQSSAGTKKSRLIKQASVMRNEAEKIALTKVPHGVVKTGDLEKEHGKLIWSFDISRPGTKDLTEVQVDAKNGEIVSVKTETAAEETAEGHEEKAKPKGK